MPLIKGTSSKDSMLNISVSRFRWRNRINIIGYIIAGMIIGPYTPPFSLISNFDVLNLFAEIGVILLLFVVGMEFPIEKLRRIGKKALVIAFSEALGTFTAGYL